MGTVLWALFLGWIASIKTAHNLIGLNFFCTKVLHNSYKNLSSWIVNLHIFFSIATLNVKTTASLFSFTFVNIQKKHLGL